MIDIDTQVTHDELFNFIEKQSAKYNKMLLKMIEDIAKNGKVTMRKLNRVERSLAFKVLKLKRD